MAPSHSKIIVGSPPEIGRAMRVWKIIDDTINLIAIPLNQNASYAFDFAPLSAYAPTSVTAFVAFGNQFLNHKRQEIFQYLKQAGFSLPPLVHPQSLVRHDTPLAENLWIEQGCIIDSTAMIGVNCTIGTGSTVGEGSSIGAHTTLEDNTRISGNCSVGSFVTLGSHVGIQAGTVIGNASRITKAGCYSGYYSAGTFIEEKFSAVMLRAASAR